MNDVLVGIECHVELNTKSKLFCGCSSKGEAPNSSCCPVCLGMPGSKPVLNEKALEYALKLCLAFSCKIDKELIFSRKIYFYPDMSKNYQITQYENPLGITGEVEILGKKIRIRRIHMEEDPAALIHEKNNVLVDYNRSGHALCEIVTEPDMHSAEEARLFMRYLLTVLKYLQIYDIKEGIVKADLNVNIAGCSRVEIKNVSGFKDIQRAIEYEITRQRKLLNDGEPIVKQETRGWDGSKTNFQRYKEQEDDYGYIFDTDLVPVETAKYLKGLKLPELPKEKRIRYTKVGLSKDDAEVIANDVELILEKKITERTGQKLMEKLGDIDINVKKYIKENNLEIMTNNIELETICKRIILTNQMVVEGYKNGNHKSINFLVGLVMRETKGTADAKLIRKIIEDLI